MITEKGSAFDWARLVQIAPWLMLFPYAATAVAQDSPAPTAVAAQAPAGAEMVAQVSGAGSSGLQEVVVTASRRREDVQKVPISITAITQQQMDKEGDRQVEDIVKFIPGLNLSETGNGGSNNISIRGISSTAGAGTTGIYIDDTPIQVRNLGYNAGSAFPSLFDLQRVEVLRGPQGTLFGAGSEGGTVRFILTQPNLTMSSVYARTELADTQNGAPSYEAGLSINGPIVTDRLGFVVSAYYRKDGGYIDAVTGTYSIADSSGALRGNSVDFAQSATVYPNANWDSIKGYRAALKFVPVDGLAITGSVIYQDKYANVEGNDGYFVSASDPSGETFKQLVYVAGDPATNPALTAVNGPSLDHSDDHFYLPALQVQWDLGPVSLFYNASYFSRDQYTYTDYTWLYESLYGSAVPNPGDKSVGYLPNSQRNIVQELRLQSSDPNARLTWVTGLFYSRDKQRSRDAIATNYLQNLATLSLGGGPDPGVAGGPPFGPGSSAFENYFGVPLLPGSVSWTSDFATIDKQLALYGQGDLRITKRLKLTAGIRVSRDSLVLNSAYGGGENNEAYAYGEPCPYASCTPGVGPFAGAYPVTNASTSATAVTPKVGLSYEPDDKNMFYATVAKGYRPAGADLLAPVSQCAYDLGNIGFLDANGNSTQTPIYKSDYVWSYEIGNKSRVFNNRALIDASAYQIRWSDIQTSVGLPFCGYSFVDNVGHATSHGVDLALQGQPLRDLTLRGSFAYNRTQFDKNSLTPNGTVLFAKGTGVPGVGSPITIALEADYERRVSTGWPIYGHIDFSYNSAERMAGNTSPSSSSYQPLLSPIPAYRLTNLRVGTRLLDDALDVSLFVNNVTDSHPDLNLTFNSFLFLWSSQTLRPRTYGITVAYRR